MGNHQHKGTNISFDKVDAAPMKSEMEEEVKSIINKFPEGLSVNAREYQRHVLSRYTIYNSNDDDKLELESKIEKKTLTKEESRAIATLIGLAIGDALGAPLEFQPVKYNNTIVTSFNDLAIWESPEGNKFRLQPGQWTDDTSMALCIADSLLVNGEFNPLDLRLRFLNWVQFGYNNSFGNNEIQRGSVGLGGNISLSMKEFSQNRTEYTTAGDKHTSGNGSLMRLAPVPIYYHDDVIKAMEIASKQSKTTHQGDEAAELCRLLTYLMIHAIHHPTDDPIPLNTLFDEVLQNFESDLYSVTCLVRSQKEERNEENQSSDLNDRNWNWRDPNFRYAPGRSAEMPGYIGSYAMDCLSMALHCVYSTTSFKEAVIKAANLRGDSDTVAAVVAQLAGAIYGLDSIPSDWIDAIQQWDNGTILLRAYKLFHHKAV